LDADFSSSMPAPWLGGVGQLDLPQLQLPEQLTQPPELPSIQVGIVWWVLCAWPVCSWRHLQGLTTLGRQLQRSYQLCVEVCTRVNAVLPARALVLHSAAAPLHSATSALLCCFTASIQLPPC
jgi:hypothetical protein